MSDPIKDMLKKYKDEAATTAKDTDSVPNPIIEEEKERMPVFKRKKEKRNTLMDTEEGNWLTKTGDQLSRGNYAPANLALEMYRGNIHTVQEAEAAHRDGFSLRKKKTWGDVFGEVFPDAAPWGKPIAGFAGDVILDEINLMPIGWIPKIGKMLGIPKLLNLAGEIPAVNKTLKAFKPGYELSKVVPNTKDFRFANAYKHKRDLELQINYYRRKILKETTERTTLFNKTAKALGADPKKSSAMMTKLHQSAQSADIIPEMKPFYDEIADGFRQIHKTEIEAGLMKDGTFRNNYFPGIYEKGRLIIKDGEITLGKPNGYFSKMSWKNQTPFSQGKTWETVDIAKKELAKIQAKGVATDIIPVEDWFKGYAIRKFVSDSAVAWKGYIDEAVDNFATPLSKHLGDANTAALRHAIDTGDMESARKLIGNIKIEKGVSFVTKTTNLRSPKMQSFALKETERALRMSEDADAVNSITNIFRHMEGKGLIELGVDDIAKMGLDDVYLMPNELSKSVKNAFKPFASDESVTGFLKGFDNGMYAWKSMATAMRVAFHPRNAVSNMWQMYLGGVNPAVMPKRLAAAGRIMLNDKTFSVNGFTAADLNKVGDRLGVKAYGMMGSDMPQSFQKQVNIATGGGRLGKAFNVEAPTGIGSALITPFKGYAEAGRKVGSAIEDNARIALMLDQIKKTGLTKASPGELLELKKIEDKLKAIKASVKPGMGDSHPMVRELAEKAAKLRVKVDREVEFNKIADHVKDYLYDYTEVTEFEKNVMGRAIPFYKWLRKNTPRQVQSLIERPEKFARLADFQRDLWPDTEKTPIEGAVIPGWMQKGGARKTNMVDADGNPVFYKVDLPIEDLHNMIGLETYMGALNPIVAMSLAAVNVKLWPEGGSISKPGLLTKAPFWADMLPPPLRNICKVKPITTPDGLRLGMDPQWKYALSTAFPFLKQWEIAYPTGTGKYVVEKNLKYKVMSDLSGVKFIPLDVKRAAKSEMYKRKEAVRHIKSARKQRKLSPDEMYDIWKESIGK